MNVLILGGGYVGNHLFNRLKRDHDVEQIVQRQVDYTFSNQDGFWEPGYKPLDFKSYLHNKRFDIAVNCCGYTGKPNVDACEKDKEKCWYYNVTAPAKTNNILNLFNIPVVHISSGCIYEGDRMWTEEDVPNFGLYDDHSSFYSKSKHAGELALKDMLGYIFRIRMPFCGNSTGKNILQKYLKYDNIVSYPNSLTSIYDLCNAVEHFCVHRCQIDYGVYNIVNRGTITGQEVIDMMREKDIDNPNWKVVPIEDLHLAAGRSNCTLSGDKLYKEYKMPHVTDSLRQCITRLKGKINGDA